MKFQISSYQIWKFKAPLCFQGLFAEIFGLLLNLSQRLVLGRPSYLPWWCSCILVLFSLITLLRGGLFVILNIRMNTLDRSRASYRYGLPFTFEPLALTLEGTGLRLSLLCLQISLADKFRLFRVIFGIVASIHSFSSTQNSHRLDILLISPIFFTFLTKFGKIFGILGHGRVLLGHSGRALPIIFRFCLLLWFYVFWTELLFLRCGRGPFRIFMNTEHSWDMII